MTLSNEDKNVCVIGMGNMGSTLAEALLAKGHNVTVWNRTASKCGALGEAGATVAASAAEAVASADTTVVCVSDHAASASVLQTDEVTVALRGKVLVQLSTVTAEESRDMGRWAEQNGIAYLDGSILGYPQGILSNDCTIIYSGPRSVFDANEGMLSAMGGKPKLVGEAVGGAPTFDKTLYANHYGSMLAFFHGAAICHAAGFPLETYVAQVVAGGAGHKPHFGELLINRSYDAAGAAMNIDAAAYDHVVRLTDEFGLDATFSTAVATLFERAKADGLGEQGFAAMFKVLINESA
jgi:3-hydroxyisobutyrate dehydrogenase-like beta-hydroxyacid dehydrogenase